MKKLQVVILLLLSTTLLHAQSFEKLINKFKEEKGVVYQNIDKNMIPNNMLESFGTGNIDQIMILNLEDCNKRIIDKFDAEIRNIKPRKGYTTLIKSNEEHEFVHILSKTEHAKIVELIILQSEKEKGNLVWLKGSGFAIGSVDSFTKR